MWYNAYSLDNAMISLNLHLGQLYIVQLVYACVRISEPLVATGNV